MMMNTAAVPTLSTRRVLIGVAVSMLGARGVIDRVALGAGAGNRAAAGPHRAALAGARASRGGRTCASSAAGNAQQASDDATRTEARDRRGAGTVSRD